MLCFFKYGVEPTPSNSSAVDHLLTGRSSKSGLSKSMKSLPSKTKLTVDDNKTLIINPNCYIQILLDYLISEIDFDKSRDFDICDTNGEMLRISELNAWENATKVLVPRRTYCIVYFERNELGHYKSFDILLNKGSDLHKEVSRRLRKYLPGSRSERRISDCKTTSKSTPRISFDRSPRINSVKSMKTKSSLSQINL